MQEVLLVILQSICALVIVWIGVLPSIYPLRKLNNGSRTLQGKWFVVLVVLAFCLVVSSGLLQLNISHDNHVNELKNKQVSDATIESLKGKIDSCNSKQDDARVLSQMEIDQLQIVNANQYKPQPIKQERPIIDLTLDAVLGHRNPLLSRINENGEKYKLQIAFTTINGVIVTSVQQRYFFVKMIKKGEYKVLSDTQWGKMENMNIYKGSSVIASTNLPAQYAGEELFVVCQLSYKNNDYNSRDVVTKIFKVRDDYVNGKINDEPSGVRNSIIAILPK